MAPRRTRDELWNLRAQSLHDHYIKHGRLPSRGISSEKQLADWVQTQRKRWDGLTETRKSILEANPQFSPSPHDDAWDDRLNEYASFLAQGGGRPRIRASDQKERTLAVWVRNQERHVRLGTLPKHRLDDFNAVSTRQSAEE